MLVGRLVLVQRQLVERLRRLVDWPSEGAYIRWICGEMRTDRRLSRAPDHVRGHFNT